jgi:hypothetical protein
MERERDIWREGGRERARSCARALVHAFNTGTVQEEDGWLVVWNLHISQRVGIQIEAILQCVITLVVQCGGDAEHRTKGDALATAHASVKNTVERARGRQQ